MSKAIPLTYKRTIQAPIAHVYRAFTNSSALKEWLCDVATADPRPGGRLYMWWTGDYYTCGEYTALEPEKKITFTWHGRGEPRPTRVEVTLTPKRGSTVLKLAHRGLGRGEAWAKAAEDFDRGWVKGLENLASVLESGPDLRVTRRPMLGIGVGEFNAQVANELGVPVVEGIRLDSVIDGMGAQAAGLQKNDVLIGMHGQPITGFAALSNVISTLSTGDEVEVTFYRGGEKRTVNMTLSQRPIPEIPSTPAALAEALKLPYASSEADLTVFLEGLTEEEASFKPAPDEWNVKEVLAHLIHSERGWQNIISEIIGGHEASYDDFGGNPQARIDATLAAYPSINALLEEYKLSTVETLVTIAHMPEDFATRKGSYWRVAFLAQQFPFHFRTHLEQMQAAVKAARK
jgi:uncharacterized protein YndB with AHSA1/START domain